MYYVRNKFQTKDVFEIVSTERPDQVLATVTKFSDSVRVSPIKDLQVDRVATAFCDELLYAPEVVACVATWSPETRESARRWYMQTNPNGRKF